MSLLANFDTSTNFWELNPLMKVPLPFATLYKKDKSADKENSSKIMWAVAMLIDTSPTNLYRRMTLIERKEMIAFDYLEDQKFNWDARKELIDYYQKLHSSKLEKDLYKLECKMEERATFIEGTSYTVDGGEKLDRIIANTKKMHDLIRELKDAIEKGDSDGKNRGDRVESASETGEI